MINIRSLKKNAIGRLDLWVWGKLLYLFGSIDFVIIAWKIINCRIICCFIFLLASQCCFTALRFVFFYHSTACVFWKLHKKAYEIYVSTRVISVWIYDDFPRLKWADCWELGHRVFVVLEKLSEMLWKILTNTQILFYLCSREMVSCAQIPVKFIICLTMRSLSKAAKYLLNNLWMPLFIEPQKY